MPSLQEWMRVSAIGATILTGATIIAALYLLVILYKQGRGKVRVRLLLGMVISDLLLGIVVFPSEVASLAHRPIKTGTTICNVQGFFLTAVLWQQHLWTLAIAVATLLLLRYSWICAPSIWTISFVHSGIWWRYAGWVSNGNLCYYQNTSTTDGVGASDLIQFIPRAIVFLSILGIYCSLFKFLRRPDTIQLSSQFVSGSVISKGAGSPKPLGGLSQKLGFKPRSPATPPAIADPKAPWEALEFVQVGGNKERGQTFSPSASHIVSIQSPIQSHHSATYTSPIMSVDLDHLPAPLPIPLESPDEKNEDDFSLHSLGRSRQSSKRPSHDVLLTPATATEPSFVQDEDGQILRNLSPIVSSGKGEVSMALPLSPQMAQTPMEAQNQTLQEFFQEYEPGNLERPTDSAEKGRSSVPQMSATAYFNRQASLLMLYFPLAYLFVFSLSIVRLIYNMASSQPSQLLTVLSSWFVLSLGFVDAVVYGLAEFLVRRRVRRKMPDRMG